MDAAEVEQLKKHMGKDGDDGFFNRVGKVLTPGSADRSRDKLQRQIEAVKTLASAGPVNRALIFAGWAQDDCMPVHDAEMKAQNVADLWNRKEEALKARSQDADYSFQEIDALLLAKDERVAYALFDLATGDDTVLAGLAQNALKNIGAPILPDELTTPALRQEARAAVTRAFQRAVAV